METIVKTSLKQKIQLKLNLNRELNLDEYILIFSAIIHHVEVMITRREKNKKKQNIS